MAKKKKRSKSASELAAEEAARKARFATGGGASAVRTAKRNVEAVTTPAQRARGERIRKAKAGVRRGKVAGAAVKALAVPARLTSGRNELLRKLGIGKKKKK